MFWLCQKYPDQLCACPLVCERLGRELRRTAVASRHKRVLVSTDTEEEVPTRRPGRLWPRERDKQGTGGCAGFVQLDGGYTRVESCLIRKPFAVHNKHHLTKPNLQTMLHLLRCHWMVLLLLANYTCAHLQVTLLCTALLGSLVKHSSGRSGCVSMRRRCESTTCPHWDKRAEPRESPGSQG